MPETKTAAEVLYDNPSSKSATPSGPTDGTIAAPRPTAEKKNTPESVQIDASFIEGDIAA